VGDSDTQHHKDADPAYDQVEILPCFQLVKRIGKKDTDQGKTTPANSLKKPIS